jgi:hypothetical protein
MAECWTAPMPGAAPPDWPGAADGTEREVFAFDDNLAALRMYRDLGTTAFEAPACWRNLSAALRHGLRRSPAHTLLAYAAKTPTFD